MLQLECSGEKEDTPADIKFRIFHEDAYLLTAAPVAACLRQYLDGAARKPGLWLMAHLVEPTRLFSDLKTMSINIEFYDYMKKPGLN
jgi:saccharopine dehydrogenase (NAD+, L-lysine-forming)